MHQTQERTPLSAVTGLKSNLISSQQQTKQQTKQQKKKKNITCAGHSSVPKSSTTPPTSSTVSLSAVEMTEQRRREQRRLSAQRRRERKRFTLNDLEIRLRQYQHTDTELRNQLCVSDGISSPSIALNTAKEMISPTTMEEESLLTEESHPVVDAIMVDTQSLLDAADRSVLYPSLPNWDEMLSRARQKVMEEAQEELAQERVVAAATDAVEPPRDKNVVRRERNRLSARMSRLRKRLRHQYLDTMLTMIGDRVHLLQEVLEKTHQQPISSVPEWDEECGGSRVVTKTDN